MRIKRIASILTAMTMVGSLFAAVTASADDDTTTETTPKATVTVAAQIRGTGGYEEMNSGTKLATTVDDDIEVKASTYMGAYYQFNIPFVAGKTIDKVTVNFTKTKNAANYSRIIKVSNPTDTTKVADIWSVVSSAMTATSFANGDGVTLLNANSDWAETDITELGFTTGANSIFIYSSRTNDDGTPSNVQYNVSCPVVTVTYKDDTNASDKVAQIGSNYYDSLSDAYNASVGGDTIYLLQDTTSTRISIKQNITIDLNGKKLTGTDSVNATTAVLEIADGSKGATIKNGEIESVDKKYAIDQKAAANTTNLENLTVDSVKINKNLIVKNCKIGTITTGAIQSSNSDMPTITADESTTITSVAVAADTTAETLIADDQLPYTLISGGISLSGINVTVPEGYTYSNSNGQISKAEEETTTTDYFKFNTSADKLTTFSKIKLNATKGEGSNAVNKDSAYVGLSTAGISSLVGITLDASAEAEFYINVTDVPADVTINSITLE